MCDQLAVLRAGLGQVGSQGSTLHCLDLDIPFYNESTSSLWENWGMNERETKNLNACSRASLPK